MFFVRSLRFFVMFKTTFCHVLSVSKHFKYFKHSKPSTDCLLDLQAAVPLSEEAWHNCTEFCSNVQRHKLIMR